MFRMVNGEREKGGREEGRDQDHHRKETRKRLKEKGKGEREHQYWVNWVSAGLMSLWNPGCNPEVQDQIIPSSAKLKNPSREMIRWSARRMSSRSPAAFNFLVMASSSLLGLRLPEG